MERLFGNIPASSGVTTFIWVFGLILGIVIIGVVAVLASFGYQSRHAVFAVSDDGLRISPGIYSRFIPKQQIDAAGVKVLNLNIDTDYKPKWRTNGAGLPGYSAGWFKLQNKEKALLFVTDRSSVVYIPTTENYSVLLSVRDADEFTELLQQWK
jgi:hypothetical protein